MRRVITAFVLVGGLLWAGGRMLPPGPSGAVARPVAAAWYEVRSGDTLWAIARRVAPDADPRAVVQALLEVNDLPGPRLRPGQMLVLPRP